MFKHEKMLFHPVEIEKANRDFGTTKAAKMYFSLSSPSPGGNSFAPEKVTPPAFQS